MLKRLNQINVKYAIAFIGMALAMLAVVIVDLFLVDSLKSRVEEFGTTFHEATTTVLNADRDLYQAQMATQGYLSADPGSAQAGRYLDTFEENATQAADRLNIFAETLADYPQILATLADFDTRMAAWRDASQQVIELQRTGQHAAAVQRFDTTVETTFGALREVYNQAGEAADAHIAAGAAAALKRAQTQEYAVIVFSLVVCLATIVVALVGPLMMSRAIRQVTSRIREIVEGDGDLTARIDTHRRDEIGDLATHFNAFIGRMDQTLQTVRRNAVSVHSAANEIAEGSQSLAERTELSASNLQETSASMEEITATVGNTAQAADQAGELSDATRTTAHEGQQAMDEMVSTMADISASANQIHAITDLIDNIAFQTNLLALNASVEAARAGEHGRGFSVVAQEVRNLATRSSEASREIRTLVDTSVSRTESGAALVKRTGETMTNIVEHIERVSEAVDQIRTGAREQSQGVSQVNVAVTELDNATQQNAAMVEQTSAAAVHMRDQANQLQALLASFRLSSDSAPVSSSTSERASEASSRALPAPHAVPQAA